MPINSKLFKAYDIRGLSPEELDEDAAYRIGQAMVKFTAAKNIVVGRDMRETTPALFESLSRGIRSQGSNVVDIGLVTTPMMYFAACDYTEHEAGMMITASHNPSEYNGVKMCLADALPIGGESGMNEIRDLALAGPHEATDNEGKMTALDIRADYLEKLLSAVDLGKIKPLKVAVDTGNGMEGVIIDDILSRVPGCQYEVLFKELDGRFPNHEANPLKEETLDALKAKVAELSADLGVAFDGDGDRIGIVDEAGEVVRGDILAALLAPLLLKESPGSAVLYDVRESMAVVEEIEQAGGQAIMTRVGHGLIKPHMREVDAVFTGELSNHFYFRDFCGAESSDLVLLLIMQLISETGQPLSELIAPLKRYYHSGEINFEVQDKEAVLSALEDKYGSQASNIIRIDGVRMEFFSDSNPEEDWWFSVRASNTEPKLRLNLEAKKEAKMEQMKVELTELIES
ncbi:phosphomannomutase/phosphoglucomutase [Patescibacteria group bacterium]|nr:phosphomannomutase/phosphoglucomutase [Patescibacteria group bacterium]MBU1028777.1 phosphomannomutase/phosphoglucomutase [Patescibacteria group bacterium]MBU1916247.1 phosphomannomutase/phosphoglucomutase [Patescibacteria group bacterium]